MTPGARVAAAAEVLDRVLAGEAAEAALTRWARASRFAGSGDRAAVRDHVYDALRRRRSLAARAGVVEQGSAAGAVLSGRALMIGLVAEAGLDLGAIFSGQGHAPPSLTPAEVAALERGATRPQEPACSLDVADWQLPLFRRTLGPRAEAALDRMRHRAAVFLRANLGLCDRDTAIARLAGDGIEASAHPLARTALVLGAGASRVRTSRAFLDGLVEVQDAAGQAACAMLPLHDGARVLDFCAGGGGKTLAIAAQAAGRGLGLTMVAHDAEPRRMTDLPERLRRAHVGDCSPPVNIRFLDLSAIGSETPFDLVLVDAPCSGSGTWARTPEAKWRLTERDLSDHVRRQAAILDTVQGLAEPGQGVLAYMTCSLFAVENTAQIRAFVERHPAWRVTAERQFDPLEGGDGFYVAILSRSGA